MLEFLQDLFNPADNGIQLLNYKQILAGAPIEIRSEMWTSSKCLLIRNSIWEEFLEELDGK